MKHSPTLGVLLTLSMLAVLVTFGFCHKDKTEENRNRPSPTQTVTPIQTVTPTPDTSNDQYCREHPKDKKRCEEFCKRVDCEE